MWKHKKCGGDIYPVNNEGDWCSDCNQREISDSDIYLEHYIINIDGNLA